MAEAVRPKQRSKRHKAKKREPCSPSKTQTELDGTNQTAIGDPCSSRSSLKVTSTTVQEQENPAMVEVTVKDLKTPVATKDLEREGQPIALLPQSTEDLLNAREMDIDQHKLKEPAKFPEEGINTGENKVESKLDDVNDYLDDVNDYAKLESAAAVADLDKGSSIVGSLTADGSKALSNTLTDYLSAEDIVCEDGKTDVVSNQSKEGVTSGVTSVTNAFEGDCFCKEPETRRVVSDSFVETLGTVDLKRKSEDKTVIEIVGDDVNSQNEVSSVAAQEATVPGWLAMPDFQMTPVEADHFTVDARTRFDAVTSRSAFPKLASNVMETQRVAVERNMEISQKVHETVVVPAFVPISHANDVLEASRNSILIPFALEELERFYYNPELTQIENFVDQFIENAKKPTDEFRELLEHYMKSRISAVALQAKIKELEEAAKEKYGLTWSEKTLHFTAEGRCSDGNKVSHTFVSTVTVFNHEVIAELSTNLKNIRSNLYEHYQLKAYDSQMARIRIESFVHEVFMSGESLKNVTSDWPISSRLPQEITPGDIGGLINVQNCISALFFFRRMGNLEPEFAKDVDEWLERMVATLQRAGALPDHFFILNHLLRCPPGSVAAVSHFLQFPSFLSPSHAMFDVWDTPLVHHFVIMLATLTLPIKQRKEFLLKFKENQGNQSGTKDMAWTLVDEEREEDENPQESWHLLGENDLAAVFEQFPFEDLLQYLLRTSKSDGKVIYDITRSNSNDVLRLLAFSTCLVNLLGEVFDIFNLLRYRQFLKRISRTIRLMVQVVSDHWCQYRNWRVVICGDSYQDIPNFLTISQQFNLSRLQLEFDNFFLRATKRILESQSFGVCQFLSCMPYDSISTHAATEVLEMLTSEKREGNREPLTPARTQRALTAVPSPSETIFLLTALSNLAVSRPAEDKAFIKSVVNYILEISFIDENTKGTCSKTGRDSLAAITESHPYIISHLLLKVEQHFDILEKEALAIFKALPVGIWNPLPSDLDVVRNWLLKCSLTSTQHQIARFIFSTLNYGFVARDGEKELFLDSGLHCAIAVMLVEVVGFCVPDAPGGLRDLQWQGSDIISQVSRIARSSYNRFMNASLQDSLVCWAFETGIMLKLHANDLGTEQQVEERRNLLVSVEDSYQEVSTSTSWFAAVAKAFSSHDPTELDVTTSPELLNVNIAVESQGPIACFVTLCLTNEGHVPDLFMKRGLTNLLTIVSAGKIDPGLKVLMNVLPLFVDRPEILVADDRFSRSLDALVHIDANLAGYTEKLWQYHEPGVYSQKFAAVILTSIATEGKRSSEDALKAVNMWMRFLMSLQNWPKDCCIQVLLDSIVKATFALEGGLEQVIDILQKEFTEILSGDFSKGFLSSVMSWISSTAASSPLSLSCHPEYNYYAYAVLSMETVLEEKCGLWTELTAELLFDEKLPLEMAYKRAQGRIKSSYLPSLGSLSIYRWAEQAISTSFDHPTLPIIWQQFFRLFLQKPSEESGLSNRHGIGYRFFRSFTYSSMAKRMKGLLLSAASYHQEKGRRKEDSEESSSPPGTSAKTHIHDQDFHVKLANLYQTLALWLDEPRLHDPSLLLAALPDVYRPDLLEQLYLGSKSLWLRYVNLTCITTEVDVLRSLWSAIIKPSSKYKRLLNREESATQMGASQKIIKRLSFENNGKPAASLPPLAPPVPEITPQILLTRPCLVQGLSGELERVVQYSKRISSLLASHVGLDEEYAELSRDLYQNIETQRTQRVGCNEKRKGCTGKATIGCQVREFVLNDRISSRLKVNREEWERLIENGLQPTPHNMCTGAVYVENVIAQLLKTLSYANPQQKSLLYDCGIRMFYLLAELIDNDIKRCNPAIQFFSSCVESLGKAFIAPNPNEQLRLIETIMENDVSVSFLAPHFSPNGDPALFTTLYAALVRGITTENVTTVFVILTKFDVLQWLDSRPSYAHREATLRNAMCALAAFGNNPPDGCSIVVDLLRGHLCILMSHRFPELYFSTLQGLLHMSADNKISAVVWSDFIVSIGGTVAGHRKPVPTPALQISMAEAEETLERLKCFFLDAFSSSDFSVLRMYHTWSVYIPSLAQLYGHLLDNCLSLLSQNVNDVTDGQRTLWLRTLDVYSVWILPNTKDDAWLQLHKQEVTVMIHSFTEFVCKACTILLNMGSSALLNSVWQYYCQDIVISLAAQEGALDLYHSLFLMLPWRNFCPTQQDLVLCLDMSSISPVPFRYVSKILFEINWTAVLAFYCSQESNGPHNTLPAFFDSLLKIVLLMASDVVLMKSTKNQFMSLVKGIFSAPWYRLSRSQVEMTCKWYADICDSTEILDDASPLSGILYLLKPICGISLVSNDTNAFVGKRTAYVRTVITILTRASTMSRSSPNRFRLALSRLLNDIESTVAADSEAMSHDLIEACISLLSSLNNFPAGVGLDAIRGAIFEYMPQTTRREVILAFISASSRAIANLEHMSDLLECAIENIFSKLSDPELKTAWDSISERFSVPELDKEEFLKVCLRKGNLLVLFAYTKVRREEQGISPSTELNILIETVQWCSQVAPDNMSEYKMVLLIHQALQITESLVGKSSVDQQVLQLSKYLLFLSHTCNQLGEEKRYDGFLGMIGIGRRSSLSPSFRVYAKCIQTFILAQMPSSSIALRIHEDSPGAIGVKGQANSNSEADRGLLYLKNMSKTKLYGGLSEQINWAVEFITNPKNCVRTGAQYSKYFMKEFFYRYNAVMSVI